MEESSASEKIGVGFGHIFREHLGDVQKSSIFGIAVIRSRADIDQVYFLPGGQYQVQLVVPIVETDIVKLDRGITFFPSTGC